MGFFSGLLISSVLFSDVVKNAVYSVASTVKNVAVKAWDKTKEVAAKAVAWMADKAEVFVGNVKKVWATVKPYINSHVRPIIQKAADGAPYPWLKGALIALDKGLGLVSNFDETPLAKKLDDAIKWAIHAARQLKEMILKPEEIQAANERKKIFESAMVQLSSEDARPIQLAELINDFILVQTAISNILEKDEVSNFEHYLRLRATQKLLKYTEQVLNQATDVEEITGDDIFLLKAGAGLLAADPVLSDADAIKLDSIIQKRAGKKLIPFVFEEMIMAWGQNLKSIDVKVDEQTKALAEDTVKLRRLEMAKKISEISTEEEADLTDLSEKTKSLQMQVDALNKQGREQRNYVYAAEGFLQTLEKSQEQLSAEGRDYLVEEGGQVGMLIIDCAQHGRPWEQLSPEEQMLIIDYANIFKNESEQRAQQLVEVAVAA